MIMIENFDYMYNQAIMFKSKYDTINNQLNEKLQQKDSLYKDMQFNIKKQTVYEKSIMYMKELIDALSKTHINHLEKLLNSAVKTIFFDKNYEIKLEVSEFRNSNNLTIFLIETLDDGSRVKTDIKDNGFGLKTIIGFILQVYFIIYNNLSPILFIDEGFSAISSQYICCLKSLLCSLKDKYGFIFVLVAHDTRFIDLADKTYEVRNGAAKLKDLGKVNS